MTTVTSPVDSFEQNVDHFRGLVRDRMPFTFIAYRSLIPAKDDDWYYLAEKVAWFVFVVFNFVEWSVRSISCVCLVVPFIPLIMDGVRFVWHRLPGVKNSELKIPSRLQKAIQIIGFVAFSVIGLTVLFQKVRPF